MRIQDTIYGEFQLNKVLEELIQSPPLQRLKGIRQGGASYLVNPKWNVTRYEHSIGVMLLIKKLGGSLQEQIAGLLHDVSHTAFSHVVDFVFDNKEEDYHEKIFHTVIKDSTIPSILEKHGFHYEQILLDESQWTLLEQPAPELCADRVDYTLRDMFTYGHILREEVDTFLDNLIVMNGKMYLKNIQVAEWFVETYYTEVIDFFMDPLNIFGYDRLASVLKLSLQKNYLSLEDFLQTDQELWTKLQSISDPEVKSLLEKIHPHVKVENNKEEFTIHRKNKVRLIDPSVYQNRHLQSASTLSQKVQKMNKLAYDRSLEGTFVKVLST
ncbi:HD domain-containing protein [Mangrovibacillus cuniculi]|uniref:HD domain-containing protein n=1 Tax=Mangrovibacillus cuniculi TaxID=2593652 RepID=A0A7S8HEZ4_9BACI|nr:HD domain-containing protein [Mangrovibacillus cuniculi]QPC45875.1 HD domain-containing protein [Mangrovibacillus cuniculi]